VSDLDRPAHAIASSIWLENLDRERGERGEVGCDESELAMASRSASSNFLDPLNSFS
jgi:hypothetical protein